MTDLIKKIIFIIIFSSIFYSFQISSSNNSKIVFELQGNYYSTIDIENRQKYLKLVNFNNNITYETAKIDLKSIILFDQFYLDRRIEPVNPNETFNQLFAKYINNEVNLELQNLYNNLEKNIILTNIKYDLQRRNIIEKNIQKNKNKIFEDLETYNLLLYNYKIDYYILNKNTYNELIKNEIIVEDLEKDDWDKILLNNNINYLYKNKDVNDFKNLDYKIKEYISIGQNFTIETDTNITIILIKKSLKSLDTVKFLINEVSTSKKINEVDLKCNKIQNLKSDEEIMVNEKKYEANKLNVKIIDSLSEINDYIVFDTDGLYKYFVLCDYELDSNYFKDMTIREKINYFAELIELDFVNYYSKYFLLNEL